MPRPFYDWVDPKWFLWALAAYYAVVIAVILVFGITRCAVYVNARYVRKDRSIGLDLEGLGDLLRLLAAPLAIFGFAAQGCLLILISVGLFFLFVWISQWLPQ